MEIDNLITIMNGSGSEKLDREYIREFCQKGSRNYYLLVSGGLAYWKPTINENCIYLIADPVIYHMMEIFNMEWDYDKFFEEVLRYSSSYSDQKKGIYYDYLSLRYLYSHTHVVIYSIFQIQKSVFKNQVINIYLPKKMFQLSTLFFSKKHQDGVTRQSSSIAIDTWPEKYPAFITKSNFLSKLWYNINFMQTPNSFYYALDFGLRKRVDNIYFCGRNSDIFSWKEQIKKQGFFVYNHFFADEADIIESKSVSNLDNEIKFSRAYLRMLRGLFPKVNFFCLEKENEVFAEFEVPKEHFISGCICD